MNVHDTCIIGGGFTAYCLAKKHPQADVLNCLSAPAGFGTRANLRINKPLNRRASSSGPQRYELPQGTLHDRLASGGNSAIWGGFIDTAMNDCQTLITTHLPEIRLWKLTPHAAIFSPGHALHVMMDRHGHVFSAADVWRTHACLEGFAVSLVTQGDEIDVTYLNRAGETFVRRYRQVLLACGVAQTLDLLARCGILRDQAITLADNQYELCPYAPGEEGYRIHFRFPAALGKFIGYRGSMDNRLFRLGPFCVSQIFGAASLRLRLRYEPQRETFLPLQREAGFGRSIHYGAMQLGDVPVAHAVRAFSPALHIYGTVSLPEILPGPVSNQIIAQVFSAAA